MLTHSEIVQLIFKTDMKCSGEDRNAPVVTTIKCARFGKWILKFSDLNLKECYISSHDGVVQVNHFKFSFLNLFQSTWKRSIMMLQSAWAANDAEGKTAGDPPSLFQYKCEHLTKRGDEGVMSAKIDNLTSLHMALLQQLVFETICHVLPSLWLLYCCEENS